VLIGAGRNSRLTVGAALGGACWEPARAIIFAASFAYRFRNQSGSGGRCEKSISACNPTDFFSKGFA